MLCDLEPCNYLEMIMDYRHSDDHSKQVHECAFLRTVNWMHAFNANEQTNKRTNERVRVCVHGVTEQTLSLSINASGIIGIAIVNRKHIQQSKSVPTAYRIPYTHKHTKNYDTQLDAYKRTKYILNEPQARER